MSRSPTDQFKIAAAEEMMVAALPPLDRHPGVFIREVLLPEWGLDVAKLARQIKVNRPNLHEVLSGKRDVSRELAYRLGAAMNDHVADLVIAYQHAWDLQQEQSRRDELRGEIERLAEPGPVPLR